MPKLLDNLVINHTLVLNKNWQAVTIISPIDAILSMYRFRSRALDGETYELFNIDEWIDYSKTLELEPYQSIRTLKFSIKKPEIIILNDYGNIPFTNVQFTRRNLYKRDNYTCQYCFNQFPASKLTVDHVIPKSKGGKTSWENCVIACYPCNARKADKTLHESNMKLSTTPKKPKWEPIFPILPSIKPDSWYKFLKI